MGQPAKGEERHIELERKYKRKLTGSFEHDSARLKEVFNFVNHNTEHYGFFAPFENIDSEILAARPRAITFKPPRRRNYWSDKNLSGYHEQDSHKRLEIRTDTKRGRDYYDMDVKRGGPATPQNPTMKRDEESRRLKDNRLKFRGFPPYMIRALQDRFGKPSKLKMPVYVEGYTAKMSYHPDGREDVTLEIKFDTCKGFNFLGGVENVIEFEIEIKELPEGMTPKEIRAIWDREEQVLNKAFSDIERIFDSKPAPLFYDLRERYKKNPKAFKKAWTKLECDWPNRPRPTP